MEPLVKPNLEEHESSKNLNCSSAYLLACEGSGPGHLFTQRDQWRNRNYLSSWLGDEALQRAVLNLKLSVSQSVHYQDKDPEGSVQNSKLHVSLHASFSYMLRQIYFTSLRHEAGQQKQEDSQTGVSLLQIVRATCSRWRLHYLQGNW